MKASKRRARAKRKSQSTAAGPKPAFSETEEAFFREGSALSTGSSSAALEAFVELEHAPPPSLWRRITARWASLIGVPLRTPG